MKLQEFFDSIGFDFDVDGHYLFLTAQNSDGYTINEVQTMSDFDADACDIILHFDQKDKNYGKSQTSRDFNVSLIVTYKDVIIREYDREVISTGRRSSRLNVCAF